MPWQRPTSVPFPTVWKRHVGTRALPSGRVPKFLIQDAPVEMYDDVIEHMVTHFIPGEPLCSNTKMADDAVSLVEIRAMWREAIQNKMALVALEEHEDGSTSLAGVNMTCVVVAEDKDKKPEFAGPSMKKVLGIVMAAANKVDVYTLYGVTAYMTAYGLSVKPAYQGQGLGLAMLQARTPMCRATGVPLTVTVFTATNSQELARRAGFEVVAQLEYKEYKDEKGEEVFPGINIKSCINMALKM